jgi:hypothetical protein
MRLRLSTRRQRLPPVLGERQRPLSLLQRVPIIMVHSQNV